MFYYLAIQSYDDNDDFEPTITSRNGVIESEKELSSSITIGYKDDKWGMYYYTLTLINKKEYDILKTFFENKKYSEMIDSNICDWVEEMNLSEHGTKISNQENRLNQEYNLKERGNHD